MAGDILDPGTVSHLEYMLCVRCMKLIRYKRQRTT